MYKSLSEVIYEIGGGGVIGVENQDAFTLICELICLTGKFHVFTYL